MDLLKECHDIRCPGQHRTMALLGARFSWPRMKEDVESDVQTCLVCQKDKRKHQKPGGLCLFSPDPQSVTMDFLSCLPRVDGLVREELILIQF